MLYDYIIETITRIQCKISKKISKWGMYLAYTLYGTFGLQEGNNLPMIGICREVLGIFSATIRRNTVKASSTEMPREIFSPASGGRQNTIITSTCTDKTYSAYKIRLIFLFSWMTLPAALWFSKIKKKDKRMGKVSEALQNKCLASCSHKNFVKNPVEWLSYYSNWYFGPEFTSILIGIDLRSTEMMPVKSSMILHNFGSASIFIFIYFFSDRRTLKFSQV